MIILQCNNTFGVLFLDVLKCLYPRITHILKCCIITAVNVTTRCAVLCYSKLSKYQFSNNLKPTRNNNYSCIQLSSYIVCFWNRRGKKDTGYLCVRISVIKQRRTSMTFIANKLAWTPFLWHVQVVCRCFSFLYSFVENYRKEEKKSLVVIVELLIGSSGRTFKYPL